MDENEIREIFARLNAAVEKGEEPDEREILKLIEGGLINLARIVARG